MLFHCEICHKSFCWWNFTAPRVVHSTEITFTKNFNFAPGHSRSQYWNHGNNNVDDESSMSSIDLAHIQLDTGTVHSFLIFSFLSRTCSTHTQSSGSCFLFHCGTSDDFRCKFTTHSNYTSGVLTVTRSELESPATTTTTTVAPPKKKQKMSQNELELVNLKRPSSSYHLWVDVIKIWRWNVTK